MKRYVYKPRHSRPGKYGRKTFGVLHPSGLNRAQRRAEVAKARRAPYAKIVRETELAREMVKKDRQERVHQKQEQAHQRALARKAKKNEHRLIEYHG